MDGSDWLDFMMGWIFAVCLLFVFAWVCVYSAEEEE